MFDHSLGYTNIYESRRLETKKFIRNNTDDCLLFEKILGFQYELNQKIAPMYNQEYEQTRKIRKITDQELTKNTVFNLCSQNIPFLFEARMMLERNDLSACANTIRSTYESIPKMFYLLHKHDETFYVICHELFNAMKPQLEYDCYQKNKSAKSDQVLSDFIDYIKKTPFGSTHNTEVDIMCDFFQKFSNQYYRNQVYVGERLKLQNVTYGLLSSNSHANTKRFTQIGNNDAETSKKYMKILIDLSFFNLYVQANTCSDKLVETNEMDDVFGFINSVNNELENYFEITNLYPNNPEYMQNLVIKPC